MMLYVAPTATANGWGWANRADGSLSPVGGGVSICQAPNDPAISLVLIHQRWDDLSAQQQWENLPNVQRVYPESLASVVPQRIATAFTAAGVAPTDTARQAIAKIRTWWPHPHLGEI